MNKISKSLLVLFLAFLIGSCFSINFVQAQNDELILEVTQECDIQYTGDSCVAELRLTDNTNEILNGEAFLGVDYQGICGDGPFDGEGIEAQFSVDNGSCLNFSGWENGTTTVSGFEIFKGISQPELEIKTAPNLCPGNYNFTLTLKGTAETGEEYITTPAILGGGGGGGYIPTTPTTPTTDTGKVTATPGEGGITTLTNPDGSEIKLIIPSDAVSQNTNFTIDVIDVSSVNQPEPETGLFLIAGLVYEIKTEVNGEFITSFNKALTLIFTYTDEQIEGLDEDSLKIYYWDDIQNQWITLENSEVDMDNNTVIASINHFTIFALMGSKIGFAEEEFKEEEKPFPITPDEESEEIEEEKETEEFEEVIERPTEDTPTTEKPQPGEAVSEDKETPAEEGGAPVDLPLQKGLPSMVAAIGMILGEISKSTFLTIIVILCLIVLVLIGVKEWRLFQKKRKNSE